MGSSVLVSSIQNKKRLSAKEAEIIFEGTVSVPKGVVSTLDFLISSIVKIQKGQRIALGLDDGFVEDTTPQINIIEGVNESKI